MKEVIDLMLEKAGGSSAGAVKVEQAPVVAGCGRDPCGVGADKRREP